MRDRLLVIAAAAAIATATLAPTQSAAAGCVNGPYYGFPALYDYYGLALPTFYYGGFYTSRVVYAPCIYRSPYGYAVRYRNVRRSW